MRRHHNNSGYRQIQRGKTRRQVAYMVDRLNKSKCKCGSGLTTKKYRRLTQYADHSDIREGIYDD